MRCAIGVTMFIVLYFGGCFLLVQGVTAMTLRSGHCRASAQVAAKEAMRIYHAPIAVGVGLLTLLTCSAPTILLKMSRRSEQKKMSQCDECSEWVAKHTRSADRSRGSENSEASPPADRQA
jgi:hypothetical protein